MANAHDNLDTGQTTNVESPCNAVTPYSIARFSDVRYGAQALWRLLLGLHREFYVQSAPALQHVPYSRFVRIVRWR